MSAKSKLIKALGDAGHRESALLLKNWGEMDVNAELMKAKMEQKKETVEEYKARGGKIDKVPASKRGQQSSFSAKPTKSVGGVYNTGKGGYAIGGEAVDEKKGKVSSTLNKDDPEMASPDKPEEGRHEACDECGHVDCECPGKKKLKKSSSKQLDEIIGVLSKKKEPSQFSQFPSASEPNKIDGPSVPLSRDPKAVQATKAKAEAKATKEAKAKIAWNKGW